MKVKILFYSGFISLSIRSCHDSIEIVIRISIVHSFVEVSFINLENDVTVMEA